ncbi:MAG: metallophosphoesterase family protein [Planctomycetota bacterium]
MKRAILSDIHGNLEALEAVLADVASQAIESIYCLGDIIGYGPNPRDCVDRAMKFDVTVLGNHDQGALFDPEGFSSGAERAIFWTRRQLESPHDPEEIRRKRWMFLCELPRQHREGSILFVHGSARNPLNEYVFPEDVYNPRKLARIFGLIPGTCFQGHTHVPGVFTEDCRFFAPHELGGCYKLNGKKAMINVGSVGQPRDGNPNASYVILEDDEKVHFRRVPYDREKTAQKIYDTPDLDNFLGDRLGEGR